MEAPVTSLIDQHGRRIRKLRISLTDKCNLRCHYCMPVDSTFMDEKRYLSPEEYVHITRELCDHGLEEVRLTGGEPLLRRSFREIASGLGKLPLLKIGLTTNGILLDKFLDDLKEARIHHLNISLDSLDPGNFRRITFGDHLKKILTNIETAQAKGFVIKINAVAMRGINDQEIFDFVEFSKRTGLEVRFLELMRIGFACRTQDKQFISAGEMIRKLETRFEMKPMTKEKDSTSFNYLVGGSAQIGFIASETQAFCGHCSRWRLSADGILRACLLKDDGLSIKDTDQAQRREIYQSLLGMKPFQRPPEVSHHMNAIGG